MSRLPRLVYVVTVPTTARVLLRGQLRFMREAGFEVTVISSPGEELEQVARREGVGVRALRMVREMDPRGDARALYDLRRQIADLRPDIVNASTPKAGLLGMVAARSLHVPIRIYLLRGLRFETTRGLSRSILLGAERAAASCAHRVISVSESVQETFLKLGLASRNKSAVLGAGSSNGVDLEHFSSERVAGTASELRYRLGLEPDELVFGFVGRPTVDKGMKELSEAWQRLTARGFRIRLLLIGSGFAGDYAVPELRAGGLSKLVQVGAVEDVAPYYALMHALVFPSHREGFPNVPLEAAAMAVPTVGFRATGTCDAVVDGQTGLLCELADVQGLERCIERYIASSELREQHGRAARDRARDLFDRRRVWRVWLSEYVKLLSSRGLSIPRGAASLLEQPYH